MPRSLLAPPIRFGTVAFPLPSLTFESDSALDSSSSRITSFSECVYRGAYPKSRNFRFLETLHLRTIVSLTPKPIDDDAEFSAWAHSQNRELGIRVVHIRTEKPKEETGGLTREGAARAIMEVLNRENLPLYVHCLDGIEVTSTLIACLRKIQGWTDAAIRSELARGANSAASRMAGAQDIAPDHLIQFVGRFGEPDGVLLPQRDRIPQWLWPGGDALEPHDAWHDQPATVQHPTLQIHFERSESYIASQKARFGAVWSTFPHSRSRTPSTLSISESSEDSHGERRSRRESLSRFLASEPHSVSHVIRNHSKASMLRQSIDASDYEPPTDLDQSWTEDMDLRTPRARPAHVDGDIPSLQDMDSTETQAELNSVPSDCVSSSLEERTPLVHPQDAHSGYMRAFSAGEDAIPPLGLDQTQGNLERPSTRSTFVDSGAEADVEAECDDVDDDDMDDDDDDVDDNYDQMRMSLTLDALDLDGY